jgi:hypothetical protein
MTRTVRQYWPAFNGRAVLNMNWDIIDFDSTVLVTASEYALDLNHPVRSPRFVGGADVTVHNVSPHGPPYDPNHGVTFVVTVDWGTPLNIVTDITVIDKPVVVQNFPLVWRRLAFTMQRQQQTNWCWAAVAASTAVFYNAATTWTQCGVANSLLSFSDCCGRGGPGHCNVGAKVTGALSAVGHFDSWQNGTLTYAQIAAQIDANRPPAIRIVWSGGGAHFISVIGYLAESSSEFVAVDDPFFGPSDISVAALTSSYQTTGSWVESTRTKS